MAIFLTDRKSSIFLKEEIKQKKLIKKNETWRLKETKMFNLVIFDTIRWSDNYTSKRRRNNLVKVVKLTKDHLNFKKLKNHWYTVLNKSKKKTRSRNSRSIYREYIPGILYLGLIDQFFSKPSFFYLLKLYSVHT